MVEGVPKKLKRSVVEFNEVLAHSDEIMQASSPAGQPGEQTSPG